MYPYKIYYTLKLYNKYKEAAEAEGGNTAEEAKKNYIKTQSQYYYNQLKQILVDNIQDLIIIQTHKLIMLKMLILNLYISVPLI